FFKALLFLGAGSVNHATNSFDMRRMGGLRLSMPITFWTFLIAALSLSGVFPLAGFWSKDEILLDAWNHNSLLFWVGTAVAGMTAFYMFRAIFMTFFGEYRGGEEPEEAGHGADQTQPHESPRSMWVPLAILAVPAVVIGWVNIGGGFGELLEGALPLEMRHFEAEIDGFVLAVSTLFALGGIGLAAAIYYYRQPSAETLRSRFGPVHTLVEQKYYLDVVAETVIVRWVLNAGVGGVLRWLDTYVIDGIANGVGSATRRAGDVARRAETGQLQAYMSLFLVGVVVATAVIFGVSADQFDRLRDWVGV
ncbi:MAG: proton-conducting transporter membrane subunit, partial [Dehalococcoidia bacterium]